MEKPVEVLNLDRLRWSDFTWIVLAIFLVLIAGGIGKRRHG